MQPSSTTSMPDRGQLPWSWRETEPLDGIAYLVLEIAEKRVTLSELVRTGKNFFQAASVVSVVRSPSQEWLANFAELWREFCLGRPNPPTSLYLVVPDEVMTYQIESFPQMPDADFVAAIQNEVYFLLHSQFNPQTHLLDAMELGTLSAPDNEQRNALFVSVAKGELDACVNKLASHGLSVLGMATPQLLYIYALSYAGYRHNLIFANRGSKVLHLAFFIDGVLQSIYELISPPVKARPVSIKSNKFGAPMKNIPATIPATMVETAGHSVSRPAGKSVNPRDISSYNTIVDNCGIDEGTEPTPEAPALPAKTLTVAHVQPAKNPTLSANDQPDSAELTIVDDKQSEVDGSQSAELTVVDGEQIVVDGSQSAELTVVDGEQIVVNGEQSAEHTIVDGEQSAEYTIVDGVDNTQVTAQDPDLTIAETDLRTGIRDPDLTIAETDLRTGIRDPDLTIAETDLRTGIRDPDLTIAETDLASSELTVADDPLAESGLQTGVSNPTPAQVHSESQPVGHTTGNSDIRAGEIPATQDILDINDSSSPEQDPLMQTVQLQLQQAIIYFSEQWPNTRLHQIVLRDLQLPESYATHLTDFLAIPVQYSTGEEKANLPETLAKDLRQREIFLVSPLYAGIIDNKQPMMYFLEDYDIRRQQRQMMKVMAGVGIAILLVWLTVVGWGYWQIRQRLHSLERQIAGLAPEVFAQEHQLETAHLQIREMLARYRLTEKITYKKYEWLQLLSHFLSSLPPEIVIQQLSLQEQNQRYTLSMSGEISLPYREALEKFEELKSRLRLHFVVASEKLYTQAKPISFTLSVQRKERK